MLEQLILNPKSTKIELLSLKYSVPVEAIRLVAQTYLYNHDELLVMMIKGGSIARPENVPILFNSIPETIEHLSQELHIPNSILASIIIDYETWEYYEQLKDNNRDR